MMWLSLTIGAALASLALAGGHERVLLGDVKALTLRSSMFTTGRRSSPIPQAQCITGCQGDLPSVIQCTNQGWDGSDYQWKCDAELDNKYRFGRVEVLCEGFDYPEDPYILKGSCGVEYSLELTDYGRKAQQGGSYGNAQPSGGSYYSNAPSTSGWGIGEVLVLLFVGYLVYAIFFADNNAANPGNGGGWFGGWRGGGGGFPGGGYPGGGYPGGSYPSGSWRPGFWSGLGMGGLMGSMWNRPRTYGTGFSGFGARPAYGGGGFSTGGPSFGGGGWSLRLS